jgi:hypothetical protein
MSNENETERTLIPAGKYKVKCVDAKVGKAKTGTIQIGCALEIVEGPQSGQMLTWYGFFTENTEERTVAAMRTLGFRGNDIRRLESMFEGATAQAVVDHEKNQDGKLVAKTNWINPIGVMMNEVLDGAELASFGKRFAGLAARLGGGSKPAGNAPSNNGRRDSRDDEPPPFDPGDRGYRR